MHRTLRTSLFLPLIFAACGGGGSSSGTASPAPSPLGSVHVVVDTATGTDAMVQFQVAAAFLEREDGSTTANLLGNPVLITLADPTGEADGLLLQRAPTGNFAKLNLLLAPGSGHMLRGDGTQATVAAPASLSVPIFDGLTHDTNGRSWLEIAHLGNAPGNTTWQPMMQGRASGGTRELQGLRVAAVAGAHVTTLWSTGDDGPLQVEFGANCTFLDDRGNSMSGSAAFLGSLRGQDNLRVRGRLFRDGRVEGDVVQRDPPRHEGPRFIGRITELRPQTESFWMNVYAEARRGSRQILSTPRRALVLAQGARIHRSSGRSSLAFGDLAVGQLAKVEWLTRTQLANGDEEVTAEEIEIAGNGNWAQMQPEWEGAVQSVDLGLGTITVVRRNNDPIIVSGQVQNTVTVQTDSGTYIERRERSGGGRSRIELQDIVPGSDRIWWRGTATGAATIDANWVRVRDDR